MTSRLTVASYGVALLLSILAIVMGVRTTHEDHRHGKAAHLATADDYAAAVAALPTPAIERSAFSEPPDPNPDAPTTQPSVERAVTGATIKQARVIFALADSKEDFELVATNPAAVARFLAGTAEPYAAYRTAQQVVREAAQPVLDRKEKEGRIEPVVEPDGPIEMPERRPGDQVRTRLSWRDGRRVAFHVRVEYGEDRDYDAAENARRDAESRLIAAVHDALAAERAIR